MHASQDLAIPPISPIYDAFWEHFNSPTTHTTPTKKHLPSDRTYYTRSSYLVFKSERVKLYISDFFSRYKRIKKKTNLCVLQNKNILREFIIQLVLWKKKVHSILNIGLECTTSMFQMTIIKIVMAHVYFLCSEHSNLNTHI